MNLKNNHTPGPWELEPGIRGVRIVSKHSFEIAEVRNSWRKFETNEANAKLISQSPSMKNVLQEVFKHIRADKFKDNDINRSYCIALIESVLKATE